MAEKANARGKRPLSQGKGGTFIQGDMSKREKWALKHKKFLGSQKEGQGFADKRKKKVMLDYHKTLKKERHNLQDWSKKLEKLYNEDNEEKKESAPKRLPKDKKRPPKDNLKSKVTKYHKEQLEYAKKKEEKDKTMLEIVTKQKEREESLAKYKQKKKEKHKKLCKRNYKGQPNMASQMEVLLKQIEKQAKS